ncbi:putative poly(glycerol-phosphate) alpha-glucosyltransferase [Streptomyces sp. YIM 130001]|uniref:glycosyltransferase n=1 Tax=Streptomyces sp. YIM 130001 TaxID=2259644 RepID=UPI000EC6B654|nr:glycosyltransferase [Streptomyces sp. YIM 130001]RII19861.1 putative poly(glycerol-phosphate) alpha-glucosyltransferase [Streptomyces sp. YIM 130001]
MTTALETTVESPLADRARDVFLVSNSVDELGGVTTWSHQMARLFTARGHRVHVVGIRPAPEGQQQRLGDELPYPTTTLYDADPPREGREATMPAQSAKLTALFRAARPGAVVIVTQVWAMEWVVRADTAGHTVIGMSHESYAATRGSSRLGRCKRYYADVDRMLPLTREDADLWISHGGMNNVGHMPNPLPVLPDAPSPRTGRVVTSIGRLEDQKGIDMLLETWAEVAPLHPDWQLHIYGDGEDEDTLRRQCWALGLDGSVRWQGRTHDPAAALRAGSVFVQSSRYEGFPLALMEAMATGVPCAAFDCAPGVREIVQDGVDGLLAPLGNITRLARHLDALMSDKALRDRMGDAARGNIQRYSTDEIVRRWEGLFAFLER